MKKYIKPQTTVLADLLPAMPIALSQISVEKDDRINNIDGILVREGEYDDEW